MSSAASYRGNSSRSATLDLVRNPRWKTSSALSKLPPSHSSPSRANLESSESCRTSLSRMLLMAQVISPRHPSTARSTRTNSHVHGGPFPSYATLSGTYLRNLKQLYATSRKPTAPFRSSHRSGQGWLFVFRAKIPLPSIPEIALASHPDQAAMEKWEMQERMCFEHGGSLSQSGLTTIFSFESSESTYRSTTSIASGRQGKSWKMGDGSVMGADSGSGVVRCQMDGQKNTMKIWLDQCWTYPRTLQGHPRTAASHAVWMISMPAPRNWESHGKWRRTSRFRRRSFSLGSAGTSTAVWFPSQFQRRKSTLKPSGNGLQPEHTRELKRRNCTASSYMLASSFRPDELTSPTWRPSWLCAPTILLFHALPLAALLKTCSGGSQFWNEAHWPEQYQDQPQSKMQQLTQTLAQKLASGSQWERGGEPGGSCQDGKLNVETLVGQKLWASCSLPSPSLPLVESPVRTSKYSATIEALLKDGGKAEAGTHPPTASLGLSTSSRNHRSLSFTHTMSQVEETRQMARQEGSFLIPRFSSQPSTSQKSCGNSSSVSMNHVPQLNFGLSSLVQPQFPFLNQSDATLTMKASQTLTRPIGHLTSSSQRRKPASERKRFNVPIPAATAGRSQTRPAPYARSLCPEPSHLRPHVLACERLRLWLPVNPRNSLDQQGKPTNLAEADLARIAEVVEQAWAEFTRESYGTGLLIYHVFCDKKGISEVQRAPASPILIASFISTVAGAYAGKAIQNYLYGIRAWHILHGVSWQVNEAELDTLLKAAE